MKNKVLLGLFLMVGTMCFSQQYSYEPLNPAFGGSYVNYSWLLSSASVQNGFSAPSNARDEQSDLDQFGQSLNSQILSQISRSLLQQQIDGIGNFDEPGTFTFGTLAVEVFETGEGLVINILDTSTGETTQVVVPN